MRDNVRINLALQGAEKLRQNLLNSVAGTRQVRDTLKQTRSQLKQLDNQAKNLSGFRESRTQLRSLSQQIKTNANQLQLWQQQQKASEAAQQNARNKLQSAKVVLQAYTHAIAANKNATQEQHQALNAARVELEKHQATYNQAGNQARKHRAEVRKLTTQAARLAKQHQTSNKRLEEHRERLRAAGVSTQHAGAQARRMRQETETLTRSLERQQSVLHKLAAREAALSRARERNRAAMNTARTGAVTSLGYGYLAARGAQGVGAFFGSGTDFDAQMSQVQALARLSRQSPLMAAMRQNARDLGARTSFSANQVAGAQGFLAMGGFAPQQITAAMPGVLDMSKAGNLELERGADISSNILGGFKLRAEQMGWVADTLTKTFTTSNTNLEMLGETMKYVGPVAAGAGVDLAQAAAMAGLLGNVGLQGSESGTALRAMLLRLSAPTAAAKDALEGLGLSVADENGNLRDMVKILEDLNYSIRGMGQTDQLEIIKNIFGERPAAAMLELLNQAGSGSLRKYVASIRDANGEAAKVAEIMGENLRGDIDRLSSAWEDVKIQVFGENNELLRELIQNVNRTVSALGNWVRENPKLVKTLTKAVLAGLAAVAVFGSLGAALFGLLLPLAATRFALQLLGIRVLPALAAAVRAPLIALRALSLILINVARLALTNPIGLIIAAIALSALLIYKYWQPIKAWLIGFFSELAKQFAPLTALIRLTLNAIKNVLSPLFPMFEKLSLWLKKAGSWFNDLLTPVKSTKEELAAAGKSGAAFARILVTALKTVLNLPGELLGVGIELGQQLIMGFSEGIEGTKTRLINSVKNAADSVKNTFKELLGIHSPSRVFKNFGSDTLAGYREGLRNATPAAQAQLKRLARQLTTTSASLALALPATAHTLDTRAPLSRQVVPAPVAGDTITININAAPGMDAQSIAYEVERLLQEHQRRKISERNAALHD